MTRPVLLGAALLVAALALVLPAAGATGPSGKVTRLERQVKALRAQVERLRTEVRVLAGANVLALRREGALKRHLVEVDPCDVTRPNGSLPPGPTFGAEFHGNGLLWVGLPVANVVVGVPGPDGTIREKFGWWRGVAGELRIEGRRLDGPAPPLRASVPEGYGESGFQASGLLFQTPGCWEVSGIVGETRLTFVTLVLAA